jgi:hypothetical protein
MFLHIVAYSLKARIVEPQQPAVTRQQPINNNRGMVFSAQSMPMVVNTAMEYIMPLLSKQLHCNRGMVFSVQSVPGLYNELS